MNRYRVGRKLKRTVYRQLGDEPSDDDSFLGIFDDPAVAEYVVKLLNIDAFVRGASWTAPF